MGIFFAALIRGFNARGVAKSASRHMKFGGGSFAALIRGFDARGVAKRASRHMKSGGVFCCTAKGV